MKTTHEQVTEYFRGQHRKQPRLATSTGELDWADVDKQVAAGRLSCVHGGHDNDNEACAWVEYRRGGEVIHRSVHVHLKQPTAQAAGTIQGF